MKKRILPAISLFVVMALAACGQKSAPGLNVTDIQNTAMAQAGTDIAMTQLTLPTNTPALPLPTFAAPTLATDAATLVLLPTTALETPVAAPVNNPNASPTPDCYQPAPPTKDLRGDTVELKLVNKAGGPVNLSMGMYEPNDEGECYTFSFSVGDKASEPITILSGCYWISGYQNGPKPSTPRTDYLCLTDTDQTRGLTINKNSIGFD